MVSLHDFHAVGLRLSSLLKLGLPVCNGVCVCVNTGIVLKGSGSESDGDRVGV